MVYNFKLADIGEGIVEGEVSKWYIKVGDVVKENQPLVEIITEKVTVELPSPADGTIMKIGPDAGKIVKVGEVIVVIDDGKEEDDVRGVSKEEAKVDKKEVIKEEIKSKKVIATPAVKRLAKEMGIDITKVVATGEDGKITEKDVKLYSKLEVQSNEERIAFRGTRKTIAERLAKSSDRVVQAWIMEEIDMTEVTELKSRLKESSSEDIKLTYMPFFVKAVIRSLKSSPRINASLDEETEDIVIKKDYNIGIATDTEQGLIVPVIKKAQDKDIKEIAKEIEELSIEAKSGKLGLEDTQGGTFTITNIGAIGGISSIPIVNYPEVAILAINKIMKKVVHWEGKIVVRDRVYLSLSFDHRVLDGADVARFLNSIRKCLENPESLMKDEQS
uniref:Branched-chain alpha-keto acid dehydrogenase subunit E2 (DLAT, aceF, pdhC) n=1 Tax=uncultured marine thaumarchaeote AD1000_19_G07 TaxID=1455897 RepID=A0A075FRC3_9ARCH|nr:branched-chain alpha-keto acid dehydrogenase subunit E2 (DLAT, aceF, pdhC) [uncultured marine thaumarchaeote AD1000_19_G07]